MVEQSPIQFLVYPMSSLVDEGESSEAIRRGDSEEVDRLGYRGNCMETGTSLRVNRLDTSCDYRELERLKE